VGAGVVVGAAQAAMKNRPTNSRAEHIIPIRIKNLFLCIETSFVIQV
jgi:hypothetical protein